MNERTWLAGPLVSALVAGCSGIPVPASQNGVGRTADQEASTASATAPVRIVPAHALEKIAQAETAMRKDDDLRVRELLEQAEAAAWLADGRERSRLLLDIYARRAELAEKQAREPSMQSESIPQTALAAPVSIEQLETNADRRRTLSLAQQAEPISGMVVTLGDVLFDVGSAVLRGGAAAAIDRVAEFLRAHPQRKVLIEGFTDSAGSNQYNVALSKRRANAVRLALLKRGVAAERTRMRGYGPAYPVASNANEAGRQQNRRVEVSISDAQGRMPARRAMSPK